MRFTRQPQQRGWEGEGRDTNTELHAGIKGSAENGGASQLRELGGQSGKGKVSRGPSSQTRRCARDWVGTAAGFPNREAPAGPGRGLGWVEGGCIPPFPQLAQAGSRAGKRAKWDSARTKGGVRYLQGAKLPMRASAMYRCATKGGPSRRVKASQSKPSGGEGLAGGAAPPCPAGLARWQQWRVLHSSTWRSGKCAAGKGSRAS